MENIDNIVKNLNNDKTPRSEFVKLMEQYNDPFLVLISCILSLRTNDKTTYPATLRMLKLGKTPKDFLKVTSDELEKAIYPVGFYRNKAAQILEISRVLVEKHDGKVPASIDAMLKFKGVGRKTANLVMAKGFGNNAICVDVHVHRICNRLGLVKTNNPDETEFALRETLPQKYWLDFNTLLVTHGQNICKPIKPECSKCSIKDYCNTFKSKK